MTTVSWHTPTGSDPCDCPGHIEFRVREQVAAFIRSCDTEYNRGQPVAEVLEVVARVVEHPDYRLTDEPTPAESAFDRRKSSGSSGAP